MFYTCELIVSLQANLYRAVEVVAAELAIKSKFKISKGIYESCSLFISIRTI